MVERHYNPDVYFLPWEGDDYEAGIDGKRLLVLGESHHHDCKKEKELPCFDPATCDAWHRNKTREMGGRWVKSPSSPAVSYRVPDVLGMLRETFWSRVAFYNYVQELLSSVTQRPSARQCQDPVAQRAFQNVLDQLQPDRILVFGKLTWDYRPKSLEHLAGKPVRNPDWRFPNYWQRKNPNIRLPTGMRGAREATHSPIRCDTRRGPLKPSYGRRIYKNGLAFPAKRRRIQLRKTFPERLDYTACLSWKSLESFIRRPLPASVARILHSMPTRDARPWGTTKRCT